MRVVAETAGWWIALSLIWVATMSSLAPADLIAGVGCALVCGIVSTVVRRSIGLSLPVDPRWVGWLGRLVATVPAETLRLLAAGPGRAGRLRFVPTHDASASRRAWGTLALSASPGSVVVAWPADGDLVIHELGTAGPDLAEAVIR